MDVSGEAAGISFATRTAVAIAQTAQAEYGDFASMHEAYGVLAEEVAEIFDAIRCKQSDPCRPASIEREALDVAAVALRIATQAYRVTR